MGGIKVTSADQWFSRCVRERSNWRCERCGSHKPLSYDGTRSGLDCAHYQGRGNWSTRFHPTNAAALCYGCHSYCDANPEYKSAWFQNLYGPDIAQEMVCLAARPAKGLKKRVREISKHYRLEYGRMVQLRAEGETGRIEFEGFEL